MRVGSTFDFSHTELKIEHEGRKVEVRSPLPPDGGSGGGGYFMLVTNKDTPILAVSVHPKQGKQLLSQRGAKGHEKSAFICFFEQDKQAFSFRVSNLTNEQVCFSIRKGPTTLAPKVNRIDLLRPKETVEVSADESADSKEMILNVLEEQVSVATDEKSAEGPKGTYYYIAAYPTGLVATPDWTAATWGASMFVCMEEAEQRYTFGFEIDPRALLFGRGPPSYGGGDDGFSRGFGGGGFGGGGGNFGGGGVACSFSGPRVPASANFGGGGFGASVAFSPSSLAPGGAGDDDVLAARVSHGETRQVNSQEVACHVEYKKGTPVTCLCLAVANPVKVLLYPQSDSKQRLEQAMFAAFKFLTAKDDAIAASIKTVFPEIECCVCMSSPPSFAYATCGHEACCEGCDGQLRDRKCPLCRGVIQGKVRVVA
jgi:hypothetical protein